MPELPEVESTVQRLYPELCGAVLQKVEVKSDRLVQQGDVNDLVGKRVLNVFRKGKYFVVCFSGGYTMVLHFVLTGRLVLNVTQNHERMFMLFDNGRGLHFDDSRNWAKLWVLATRQMPSFDTITALGRDALDPDVTGVWLYQQCVGSTASIKEWLMDQQNIAGIGNLYATEILFEAEVDPRRYATTLSSDECARIADAIKRVLNEYLKLEVERGWEATKGKPKIYGRAGKRCYHCGDTIEAAELGGRTTCWCPTCQGQEV